MPEFIEKFLNLGVPTWIAILVCVIIWNISTYVVTVLDKRAAQQHRRRVPERRFIFFAATLGGVGVLVGFYTAHHKTKKPYLLVGVWTLTIIWAAVIAVLALMRLF